MELGGDFEATGTHPKCTGQSRTETRGIIGGRKRDIFSLLYGGGKLAVIPRASVPYLF